MAKDVQLEAITAKLREHITEIVAVNKNLSITRQNLTDLEKKCSEIDRLHSIHGKFDELSKKVSSDLLTQNIKRQEVSDSVANHAVSISEIIKKHDEILDSIKNISEIDAKHKEKNSQQHLHHEIAIKNNSEYVLRVLNNSIDMLRKELSVSPKDVFSQNKELMDVLEKARLDSCSAMEIVMEQDNRYRILESKLKQMSEQINKLDPSIKK